MINSQHSILIAASAKAWTTSRRHGLFLSSTEPRRVTSRVQYPVREPRLDAGGLRLVVIVGQVFKQESAIGQVFIHH